MAGRGCRLPADWRTPAVTPGRSTTARPAQFYLRLEVRDEAGNVGVHETPEPVTIDQSRPTIRVRDVRPVGQTSARQGPAL